MHLQFENRLHSGTTSKYFSAEIGGWRGSKDEHAKYVCFPIINNIKTKIENTKNQELILNMNGMRTNYVHPSLTISML